MTYKIEITEHDNTNTMMDAISFDNLYKVYDDKVRASIAAETLATQIAKSINGNIARLRKTAEGPMTVVFNSKGSSVGVIRAIEKR